MEDITNGLGIEIVLSDDEAFLKIAETLERIGIASHTTQTLYQTCHILHKKGRYFIMMFKEMFKLDGRASTLTKEDIQRRNRITKLLESWSLCKIKDPKKILEDDNIFIRVIKHSEKANWTLSPKYSIGVKK